ncbi:MAG: ABC transporter permease [Isosphaeraceae bacterium]
MPIFDQGYQHWHGKLSGPSGRWMPITRHGVEVQLKSRWVRIILAVACLPAAVLACLLALWGLFEQQSEFLTPFLFLFQNLPEEVKAGPKGFRAPLWTLAFRQFLDIQLPIAMILVLLVGPDLISQDLRFNAIPLYLSRPLRRFEYFLGKLGVIGAFLAAVTIVPALVAFVLGYSFSLDPTVVRDTGRLFLASMAFGAIVVVSAGLLMLALSSLSRNSRYVGAMWLGLWLVGNMTAGVLERTVRADWCPLVSYTGNLRRVRDALFDAETSWDKVTNVFQAGSRAGQNLIMGPFGPGRGPRFRKGAPDSRSPFGPQRQSDRERRVQDRLRRSSLAPETYPWEWSAGVLAGLAAVSVGVLTTRIRSLDRLR